MLIIYIITIIILTILVYFCDYKINENSIVSAIIKSILFLILSIGLAYLILYLRGELIFIPSKKDKDKFKPFNKKDFNYDVKNVQKNLLKAIDLTTDTIPGEINKNLKKDENFFTNYISN